MLIFTIEVNAPPDMAHGIKEDIAMYAERYGDARVVSVVEKTPPSPEQMTMGGFHREN